MPYLEEIICRINDNYKKVFTDKTLGKNKIFGLTQPIQRKGKADIIPAYLDKGEWKYVGFDDIDNLRIYHKLYTNNYDLIQGTSYGRTGGLEKCTSTLGLVVFGMRNKLNLSQYELEKLVNRNLLDRLTKADTTAFLLKSVIIGATSSVMDMATVFSNEIKNVEYFLTEKHILFEMRYTIEATYQKECFPTC